MFDVLYWEMSYEKSFHDVSREMNEEPNAPVDRTNTWWF